MIGAEVTELIQGYVVGQTLEPGSAITRGQALILRLERSGVSGARSRSEP